MTGRLKIIDFGSAEVVRTPWEHQSHMVRGIRGSDPYIAPEIWASKAGNQHYDGVEADIWAAGVLLICLTERHFPWSVAKNSEPLFLKWVRVCESTVSSDVTSQNQPDGNTELKESIRQLAPDLPTASWDCIHGMLETNPQKRWSINDVCADQWVASIDVCHGSYTSRHHQHVNVGEPLR